jgi:hypothetical protein
MKSIYLDDRLKKKYMDDFISRVIPFDGSEAWKLDYGLADILLSVNKNSNIQSLYSKNDSFANPGFLHESYLEFCYTPEVELKLFREVIPAFNYDFNKEFNSLFYYQFSYRRENPNLKEKGLSGLGCVDDENYFMVNTIRLSLESPIKLNHENFWKRAGDSLSKLQQ